MKHALLIFALFSSAASQAQTYQYQYGPNTFSSDGSYSYSDGMNTFSYPAPDSFINQQMNDLQYNFSMPDEP